MREKVFCYVFKSGIDINGHIYLFFVSEFIVAFKGYYSSKARDGFMSAALRDAGVTSWKILPRDNIISRLPSDFDVIKVSKLNQVI